MFGYLKTLIFALFGIKAKPKSFLNGVSVVFYTDASFFGKHGSIVVTSYSRNLINVVVDFVFVGMHKPPPLTDAVLAAIFKAAKEQGYTPNYLYSYGGSARKADTNSTIVFDRSPEAVIAEVTDVPDEVMGNIAKCTPLNNKPPEAQYAFAMQNIVDTLKQSKNGASNG